MIAIWQIQSINEAITNTSEVFVFKLPPTGPDAPSGYSVYLNENINDYIHYNDKRRAWIDSVKVNGNVFYFPVKYKNNEFFSPVTEYSVVMRLAELYLIRSEARASQGKISDALNDLNLIRNRAGLTNIISTNQEEILDKILQERRAEFFTEWGHRWLDLKRAEIATAVLEQIKGSNWTANDELYPIPQVDLDINIGLKGQQNPGY
jgi:hypothetical protein